MAQDILRAPKILSDLFIAPTVLLHGSSDLMRFRRTPEGVRPIHRRDFLNMCRSLGGWHLQRERSKERRTTWGRGWCQRSSQLASADCKRIVQQLHPNVWQWLRPLGDISFRLCAASRRAALDLVRDSLGQGRRVRSREEPRRGTNEGRLRSTKMGNDGRLKARTKLNSLDISRWC